MIYLLFGDQMDKKDPFIAGIKSASPAFQSASFDIENLDGSSISKDDLKKALVALPMAAEKRLVIVTNVNKLKTADIQSLAGFIATRPTHVDIVLETSLFELPSAFKAIEAASQVKVFGQPAPKPFEITNHMQRSQTALALKSLNRFIDDGMYPANILGVLVWYWGKHGRQFSSKNFQQGLLLLEEADLNIKRSRLNPGYALEKVVVQLVELQK